MSEPRWWPAADGGRLKSWPIAVGEDDWAWVVLWEPRPGLLTVGVIQPSRGAEQVVRSPRTYRTLYGARMAAMQARIDYSPGGRLYADTRGR